MNWQGAEQLVAEAVGGERVLDKASQLLDIDVRGANGKTYSVKFQKAAAKYHNISFEMELGAEDGSTLLGNFARCAADYCAVVIPWDAGEEILCWETRALKAFLADKQYPLKGLTFAAVATNGDRKFKFAQNLIVPIAHLRDIAAWAKVYPRSDA